MKPSIVLAGASPYFDIFPEGHVPVKTLVPVGGAYMLDGDRITTRQMQAIVERVAEQFGARVKDVRDELIEKGLPIRASEVAMHPAIPLRYFL